MRVLPILFNGDMVRAILDGRKTVTRRIVKKQPEISLDGTECECRHEKGFYDMGGNNWACRQCGYGVIPMRGGSWIHALYQPGDILYVRETWCGWHLPHGELLYRYKATDPNDNKTPKGPEYDEEWEVIPWRPSIHMPKAAARIWLKVTDVRVERIKDMCSDYDNFLKEGLIQEHGFRSELANCFKRLWNSTIKKSDLDRYGWDANPWVWVIEFERCEKPEEV